METEDNPLGVRGLDIKIDDSNWGFKGKNYLFLIGIDKYEHWPSLKCAVKDVLDFAEILTSRYQFEESDIIILKNADATEKKILSAFKKLADTVTDQDNLVIYFSGHGHYMSKTGYWIPVNANVGDECEDEFINTAIIVDRLRTINSLHTFLIIDACFSGTLITQIKGAAPKSEKYKSRRVLTSGRAEVVSDGPEGGNSPFAAGILNELRHNTDPYISASKLIAEVREYVEKQAQQTPNDARLINADDQGGDFIFHLKLSEAEIWANVVQQHTKDAYKKFADQFPDSTHHSEALEASEWLAANEANTIKAVSDYLSKYQGVGKYIALAIQKLETLEEEENWQKTKSRNTLSGFFQYINQYPTGKYAKEAKEEISKRVTDDDDKAFVKVIEEGSEKAFKEYLDKPGEKKYVREAERKLHTPDPVTVEKPDEEKAWTRAKAVNTFISFQDFTRAFPDSKYLVEAEEKMTYMDNVALNRIKIMEKSTSLPLKEKIDKCIHYFHEFPAAPNNRRVKQIKDRLEIERSGL